MKKIVCWLLAAVLSLGCVSCFAEGTESAKSSGFLQIKEGAEALVYENPGDASSVAQLAAGSLCGLLGESAEAGSLWYFVFYLNSEKKGVAGYIKAGDAISLDEAALKALLQDPDKVNEVLDLVDAMNEYLKTGASPAAGGKADTRSGLAKLYDDAMALLSGIFNSDVAGEIQNAASTAANEAGDLLKKVKGIAESNLEVNVDDLVNSISDSALPLDIFGDGTTDKVTDLVSTILNSDVVQNLPGAAGMFTTYITNEGLEKVQDLIAQFSGK